jgi:hypothetical protein
MSCRNNTHTQTQFTADKLIKFLAGVKNISRPRMKDFPKSGRGGGGGARVFLMGSHMLHVCLPVFSCQAAGAFIN